MFGKKKYLDEIARLKSELMHLKEDHVLEVEKSRIIDRTNADLRLKLENAYDDNKQLEADLANANKRCSDIIDGSIASINTLLENELKQHSRPTQYARGLQDAIKCVEVCKYAD